MNRRRPPGCREPAVATTAAMIAVAVVVLIAAVALRVGPSVGSPHAGADETSTTGATTTVDPSTTDPTSTTLGSTTTDAVGGSTSSSSTSTSAPDGSSSTTTTGTGAPLDGDAGSGFGPQVPFDPASKVALPAAIAQARTQKAEADRALALAHAAQDGAQQAARGVDTPVRGLSGGDRARFERALKARRLLTEQAVTAFVQGGSASAVGLLGSASPSDLATGMVMLDSVLEQLEAQSRAYSSDRAALSGPLRARLDQVTRVTADLASAQSSVATATLVDQAAQWQLVTFQAASHVWVPGFIFPVAGPTSFGDTFGDARLAGTTEQHWHEGCDVTAAAGTPLVAVEDGVLTTYGGSDPLGGLSLFLQGASGYRYYYAHLSAFVPGLKAGDPVTAGQVIGYVGATGDALAPHLHFEIHEPDGRVLDAHGLLVAAWSARQAALGLPAGDPAQPPTDIDPGTPGGFPRAPDGSPVAVGPPISPNPPN